MQSLFWSRCSYPDIGSWEGEFWDSSIEIKNSIYDLFHAVAESQEPVPTLSDAVSPQKSALYPIDKPRTVPKNISPE